MNLKEYELVKNYTYNEYCNYLKEKYGNVPYKYGNKKNHRKGLFIHHIGEYEIPSLSNTQVRKETDPKYQEPEMLCYSDYLEHLLLHIMIGRETNPADSLGLNGPCQYIIPALINYYQDGYQNPRWDNEYYALLDGNRDVFDLLLAEYNDLVKDIDVVLEHNTNLYVQVEHMLDTKNKALVVLGTGCGKTTTALQYIKTHKCRALLIGPNNLIKEGWSNNGDWVDTITYQAFANKYNTINYSQYGLVIIDEAHHAGYDAELGKGAKTWGKAIQYLVDNNIKLLGLTATPDRNDGIMLGETLFSDCVCQGLSVEEAIEQGIVYPFSYITSIYDKQGITEELQQLGCYKGTEDPERIKLQGQLDLALNNIPDATNILKKHMPHNKRKGIIFIQEIADAPLAIDFFKQAFPEAKFKELHSKLSKQEIKEAREWFENTDEGYLIAINMISEGAHYPGVNTIIMFRRTSSYLLYMQQIGRIITITKKENPDAIVFDLVNNINTIKPGDRTRGFDRPNINSELKRVLFKVRNFKSSQIIVKDYCQDFVERLKKLKEYSDNAWEDWEIDIIKKYYKSKGVQECLYQIDKIWLEKYPNSLKIGEHHRSYEAIKRVAAIKNLNNKNINKFWSKEEDNIIKKYYIYISAKEMEDLLPGRKYVNIQQRASKLKIKKLNNNFTKEEIKTIKENNKYMSYEELAKLLPGRTISSVKTYAIKHGIKNKQTINAQQRIEDIKKLADENKSQKEIAEILNISRNSVANICKKENISLIKERDKKNYKTYNQRAVVCVETKAIYPSVSEAKRQTGIKAIDQVVIGKLKTAGGYHWKYVE